MIETAEKQTFNIPYPPQQIFKYRGNIQAPAAAVMNQEQSMFVLQRVDIPPSGGIFAYFEGVEHPTKGFPFPEAMYATNFCKKILKGVIAVIAQKDNAKEFLAFILSSKKNKIRKISRALEQYQQVAFYILQPYYLKDIHNSLFTLEIRKFILTFLQIIGIAEDLATRSAETISTLIQYDNAYTLRAQDTLSETTKQAMLANPRAEIKRLMKIIAEREPTYGKQALSTDDGIKLQKQEEGTTYNRFEQIARLVSWALYIPSIKKAFRKSLEQSEFKNFQLDDADRYHVLLWADYNFLGKPIEERVKMYEEIHKNGFPRRITYKPNG